MKWILEAAKSPYLKRVTKQVAWAAVLLPLVYVFRPDLIPFPVFQFWSVHGNLGAWLGSLWPIFAWAIGTTVLSIFLRVVTTSVTINTAEELLKIGTLISARAGFLEELLFRWLFFYSFIIILKATNWVMFGFVDHGVLEWLHLNVLGPIANLTTFGKLEPYLFHASGWAVGASLLASNGFFRNGHSYQGLFGLVNSWVLGMVFFWTMFTYGLLVAMVAHFLYDFLIFATIYVLMRLSERR